MICVVFLCSYTCNMHYIYAASASAYIQYACNILYYMHIVHISSAIYISVMHILSAIYADIYYITCLHIMQITCIICLRLHTIRITRRHAATSSAQFNYTVKMRQNRLHTGLICVTVPGTPSIRQHTSAYVSITCVRGPGTPNRRCQGVGFAGFLNKCMREDVAV
jgi:hypothetical protein